MVEDMFRDRARLNSEGYQHRVAKTVEHMLVRNASFMLFKVADWALSKKGQTTFSWQLQ